MNVYRIIRDTPEELVGLLAGIQGEYHALEERTERRDYFMKKRRVFNEEHPDDITRAALFIFFMRTCYRPMNKVVMVAEMGSTMWIQPLLNASPANS